MSFTKMTVQTLLALPLVAFTACAGGPVSTTGALGDDVAATTATVVDASPPSSPLVPSASPAGEKSSSPKPGEPESMPPAPVDRPPPAHIETKTGSIEMAQSSYCWGGTCADYVSSESRDDLPSVPTEMGEKVTFHLGFQPKSVDLHFSGGRTVHLEASKDPTWTVDRLGVVSIFATVDRGDSSYAVRLAPR